MLQLNSSVQFVTGRRRAADSSLLRRSNQSSLWSQGAWPPHCRSATPRSSTLSPSNLSLLSISPDVFFNVLHSALSWLWPVLQPHGLKPGGRLMSWSLVAAQCRWRLLDPQPGDSEGGTDWRGRPLLATYHPLNKWWGNWGHMPHVKLFKMGNLKTLHEQ